MVPNPYQDTKRRKSKGELEVEQGSLLLVLFRSLKVAMPHKEDAAAVERVGALLQRRWPWLAGFAAKVQEAIARKGKS